MLHFHRTCLISFGFLAGLIAAGDNAIVWNTPAYAVAGEEFSGTVEFPYQNNLTVGFRTKAKMNDVRVEPANDGKACKFSFEVPPVDLHEPLDLLLFEPVNGSTSLTVRSNTQVPAVEKQEYDITGDAAIELSFDVPEMNGRAVFVPCCTIYSGTLWAYTVSVNPAGNSTGLPEHIELPYSVLEPDNLTATTSGLAIELKHGDPPAEGLQPFIAIYNKRISSWEPVDDAKYDTEAKTFRAECPNGGYFIIGWTAR